MQNRWSCLLFFFLLFTLSTVKGQVRESCYNCSQDSLQVVLSKTKAPAEQVRLLVFLVDHNATFGVSSIPFLKRLLNANARAKVIDDTPYRTYLAGLEVMEEDPAKALPLLLKAIEQFDAQDKPVLELLAGVRGLYNKLGKQTERYNYYTTKLAYYLKKGDMVGVAACYHGLAGYYTFMADYNQAIGYYLKAADLFETFSTPWYANNLMVVGDSYVSWGNDERANYYLEKALPIYYSDISEDNKAYIQLALSRIALKKKQFQQALSYTDQALKNSSSLKADQGYYEASNLQKALVLVSMERYQEALPFLRKADSLSKKSGTTLINYFGRFELDYVYYLYYQKNKDPEKAEQRLVAAYQKAAQGNGRELKPKYLRELLMFYSRENKPLLSQKYTEAYLALSDSLEQGQNAQKVAQYERDQKERDQKAIISTLEEQSALQELALSQRNNMLWAGLAGFILVCGFLVFIYRQLRINRRTLLKLKATQNQLVQSEKLASLGELTAGIAHEIQNPLNFVNNFSEVSSELLVEMEEELRKGDVEEALFISADVKANLDKIHHHGKRADSIVKSMLQHSRSNTGERTRTNLNTLADEFLKLSYHGLRAKDKSFNTHMVTDFERGLPKIDVVQQDIGRVLLNLFNNAFYAVQQKGKLALVGTDEPAYQPTVTVTTRQQDGYLVIVVRDNGMGIPAAIKDKIFQPFFTTKPTGEGTGLGLSLSYDIITKGHGGTIVLESEEAEFTQFTITLPTATVLEAVLL